MMSNKINGFELSLKGEQKWPPSFVKIEPFDIINEEVTIKHICVQPTEKPIIGQEKVLE